MCVCVCVCVCVFVLQTSPSVENGVYVSKESMVLSVRHRETPSGLLAREDGNIAAAFPKISRYVAADALLQSLSALRKKGEAAVVCAALLRGGGHSARCFALKDVGGLCRGRAAAQRRASAETSFAMET